MVEEIAQHPLIVGRNTALSHRAATICYYTQGFCAWAKRDWRTGLTKFMRVKEILDREPALRSDLAKRYVRTLHYIINAQIELGEFKGAREHIKLMRGMPEVKGFGGIQIAVQVFNASFLGELRLLDRMGEHLKALELVPAVLAGLEEEGPRLHKEQELEFWWALSCVHFGAGEMNKALFWLNKLLNDTEPTLRQDLFTYARLFNLVVHYELGNYDLLEYIVRSTHRFLSKRHRANATETVLIDHVKRLARATQPGARRELHRSLHERLSELMEDPLERLALKYFDFMAWSTAKVEGISYSEAVRHRAGKGLQV